MTLIRSSDEDVIIDCGMLFPYEECFDINYLIPDFSLIDPARCRNIIITHGHEDHIADLVSIAKRTGAICVCAYEIYVWLNKQGVTNAHPMNTGGRKDFGDFAVKCTVAHHSSSFLRLS